MGTYFSQKIKSKQVYNPKTSNASFIIGANVRARKFVFQKISDPMTGSTHFTSKFIYFSSA